MSRSRQILRPPPLDCPSDNQTCDWKSMEPVDCFLITKLGTGTLPELSKAP